MEAAAAKNISSGGTHDHKQEQKKNMAVAKVGGLGGGVGGLVLLGGALATLTIASAFAITKRRKPSAPTTKDHRPPTDSSDNTKEKVNDKDESAAKGLRFILSEEHPSSNGKKKMDATQIGSVSKNVILDEKPELKIDDHNSGANAEELPFPVIDSSKPENPMNDYSTEDVGVKREDANHDDEITDEEKNSQMLVNPEDEQKVDRDDREEEEEEEEEKTIHEDRQEAINEADEAGKGDEEIEIKPEEQLTEVGKEDKCEENDGGEVNERDGADEITIEEESQTVQSEETESPTTGDHDIISNDSIPENCLSEGSGITVEEFPLPLIANPSLPKPDDEKNNDLTEQSPAVDAVHTNWVAVDDDPHFVLDDEEEEESSEDSADMAEESSEGTGDSSVESNTDVIWPAESIQELFQEMKSKSKKIEPEIEEEDGTVETQVYQIHNTTDDANVKAISREAIEEKGKPTMTFAQKYMAELAVQGVEAANSLKPTMTSAQKYMTELAAQSNEAANSLKLRVWIWPIAVLVWCLCYHYFGSTFVKLCLIGMLVAVLTKLN